MPANYRAPDPSGARNVEHDSLFGPPSLRLVVSGRPRSGHIDLGDDSAARCRSDATEHSFLVGGVDIEVVMFFLI